MGSITKFCDAMRWAADSNQVGYSQSDRWDVEFFGDGLYNADCSSLVIQALRYAGFDTGGATYTGNMSSELCARGWVRVANDGNPRKGDILLNDANHVAVWLGDCLAQASIDENGNIAGGSRGDQTTAEVNTRSYYNYPWNCYLRWAGSDEEPQYESEDDEMSCIFQPNGESRLVYYDGNECHPLEHPDEVEAINMVYKATHGGNSIPMFALGEKGAPWATRFMAAVSRKG